MGWTKRSLVALAATVSMYGGCKEEAPKKKPSSSYNNGGYYQQTPNYSDQSQTSGYNQYGQQGLGNTCTNYRDPLSCQNGGSCLWNQALQSCSSSLGGAVGGTGLGNQCSTVLDQTQCNQMQAQGCSWGLDYITNQVRCGHQCEQNSNQTSCMAAATLGCQWGPAQLGSNLFRCQPAGSLTQQGYGTYGQPGYQQPGINGQPGYQQPY